MRRFLLAAAVTCIVLAAAPCRAQPAGTDNSAPARELVIGTKEAPPFAMKGADGNWTGISIELWQRVADQLHLHYRFSERADVQELIDGVATGKLDLAVAAVTVTATRAQVLDFTQPFFSSGLGIAVLVGDEASWMPIIRTLTSFGFFQAVLVLVGLALASGVLVWVFERRHNEDFGGGIARGLSTGVWWSAVAMTQRHTGDLGPRTLPGRVVAIVWMVVSIVTIAVFTASVTSTLTIKHLQGLVHGVSDLSSVRVGAVAGTSTEDTLDRLKVSYRTFAAPENGLRSLRTHSIDAFVYDKPLLAWLIRQRFSSSIELVDTTFAPQEYAFAITSNNPLEKSINVAILDAIHSDWWEQTTFRYLGSR